MPTSSIENDIPATGPKGERFKIVCRTAVPQVEGPGLMQEVALQIFFTPEGDPVERQDYGFLVHRKDGKETAAVVFPTHDAEQQNRKWQGHNPYLRR